MIGKLFLSVCMLCVIAGTAIAAHPLITDDTGTQGKGKFQFELNGEYGHESADGTTINTKALAGMLSYGATDNLDIVAGIPYRLLRVKEPGDINRQNGISDVSVEFKWRFYNIDGLSLGLKPGITLPTGAEGKGLGAGKTTYSMFFIATNELKPWEVHMNLGYIRNENKGDGRKNLWHASVAGELEVMKDLKVVGNIGIQRNTDRTGYNHPAFILGGVIYSLSENLDIDFGIKRGLNRAETDYSVLAGITRRF